MMYTTNRRRLLLVASGRRGTGLKLLQNVTIEVYDLTGRQVATLVNRRREAGVYHTWWNATNFSSGTYFCRMKAGEFASTQTMVLVK
jgi:3-deoxy-D-manno-octulosonate 8-phosphate phosphatase KdsC-like HAD superfamily phosphatase